MDTNAFNKLRRIALFLFFLSRNVKPLSIANETDQLK